MVTASISLRGVGRAFGATRALAGVDLDLEPGVTGLLGPNGAGKTTLLRLLATALPPSQGQVSVLGLDPGVPAQRTGIRRQLGYQPQQVGFPRGFTAFAFVDYIALLKEWTEPAARHAEVRRVLALVGLSGLGAKRIRAMSGGQRRRVALAQALLGSPPVLILDEPTTGVDPEQRVVLRAVLAEIARTSVVVLSTHQTEDVAALCERVIVLDGGRVRYDGPLRAKAILVDPVAEWARIEREAGDPAYVLSRYVTVLALIPAAFSFIGACVVGVVMPNGVAVRAPVFNGLFGAVFGYVSTCATVLLLGLIVNLSAPWFGGRRDFDKAFKLAVYSFTPVWLGRNISGAAGTALSGVYRFLRRVYFLARPAAADKVARGQIVELHRIDRRLRVYARLRRGRRAVSRVRHAGTLRLSWPDWFRPSTTSWRKRRGCPQQVRA